MNKAYISQVFQRQMEQMRNIKNLIFDNDAMGELPPLTRLLFAGLLRDAWRTIPGRLRRL